MLNMLTAPNYDKPLGHIKYVQPVASQSKVTRLGIAKVRILLNFLFFFNLLGGTPLYAPLGLRPRPLPSAPPTHRRNIYTIVLKAGP